MSRKTVIIEEQERRAVGEVGAEDRRGGSTKQHQYY